MFKRAVFALLTMVGTSATGNENTCVPSVSSPQCTILLNGKFLMHSVDDHRVFVAIDTTSPAQSDGRLDHLILLTYMAGRVPESIPSGVLQKTFVGSVVLDSAAKTLALRTRDGDAITVSLADVQWSHYWGYDRTAPRLEELTHAELDPDCDHTQRSCWRWRDFEIDFPS
jgi:hypothetical protein